MRKQELIHLHGLLAEVADHCAGGDPVDFDTYQSVGVSPTSIHRSKTDHKEAVFALADGLTTTLRDDSDASVETTSASAD